MDDFRVQRGEECLKEERQCFLEIFDLIEAYSRELQALRYGPKLLPIALWFWQEEDIASSAKDDGAGKI
jgi:hypothetical protein